jgi:hypothetical protein
MKLGDYGKAFRHLTGNGLAAPTAANYLAMEKLFPARNYDLVFPPIVGPQLNISLPDVQASLFKSSQRKKTSPDSFGYSGALLSLTRAAKSTPEAPAFHTVLATFMHKVVNIQGPDDPEAPPPLVAFLLKAGVAFGSHKDDLATQRHKQALGQPPSLRPVVAGTLIYRATLTVALVAECVQQAKESVQPVQVGLGVSNGSLIFCATAQAAFVLRYLQGTEDVTQCFQNVDRQVAMDVFVAAVPRMAALFIFFYGFDSVAFFAITGSAPGQLWSSVGFTQGCNLGSLGTALFLKKWCTLSCSSSFRTWIFLLRWTTYCPSSNRPTMTLTTGGSIAMPITPVFDASMKSLSGTSLACRFTQTREPSSSPREHPMSTPVWCLFFLPISGSFAATNVVELSSALMLIAVVPYLVLSRTSFTLNFKPSLICPPPRPIWLRGSPPE